MPILGSFGAAAARGFGLSGGKGPVVVDYVIQGGGGGGGFYIGGGGGAGGYVAATGLELARGESFTVTVGAPGPADGGRSGCTARAAPPGPAPRPHRGGPRHRACRSRTTPTAWPRGD